MTDDINKLLNPIAQDELEVLRKHKSDIRVIRKALIKAKKAGLDVAQQEKDLNDNEAKLDKFLSVYDVMQ